MGQLLEETLRNGGSIDFNGDGRIDFEVRIEGNKRTNINHFSGRPFSMSEYIDERPVRYSSSPLPDGTFGHNQVTEYSETARRRYTTIDIDRDGRVDQIIETTEDLVPGGRKRQVMKRVTYSDLGIPTTTVLFDHTGSNVMRCFQ